MGQEDKGYLLEGIEPRAALSFFEDVTRIPRGSTNEKEICDYLMAFAAARGLEAVCDAWWNVCIKKPGQGRNAAAAPVALQGHTDMVCEKNSGVEHDFLRDPIPYYRDGDWVRARGTTLGADNGVAVAMMLGFLDDQTTPHPPLECLFTSQEELGLDGARHVPAEWVKARRLINLDAGPEGTAIVGSAGGILTTLRLPCQMEPCEQKALRIGVTGLTGGHSGSDIAQDRANANKLLAHLLCAAREMTALRLVEISGGSKDNAIPREAFATIAVHDVAAAQEASSALFDELRADYAATDPLMTLVLEPCQATCCMDETATNALLDLLTLLPNGVQRWDKALDCTLASENLGVVATREGEVSILCSIRSASDSAQRELVARNQLLAKTFGAAFDLSNEYPSWPYQENAPLRELCAQLYREQTGKTLVCKTTHGGLECGLFLAKWPDLDILAIGCDSVAHHSPDEALNLPSFERVYEFVKLLLCKLQ